MPPTRLTAAFLVHLLTGDRGSILTKFHSFNPGASVTSEIFYQMAEVKVRPACCQVSGLSGTRILARCDHPGWKHSQLALLNCV